jgi:hypothetical protein
MSARVVLRIIAFCQSGDVLQDGQFITADNLATGGAVAARDGICPRDVKRGDLRVGGTREREPDLNAATRCLRTAHRDQNPAVPLSGQSAPAVANIDHRERSFDTLHEHRRPS